MQLWESLNHCQKPGNLPWERMAQCWPCISEHLLLTWLEMAQGLDGAWVQHSPATLMSFCALKERDFKWSNINFSHAGGSLGLLTPGSSADIGDKRAFPGHELTTHVQQGRQLIPLLLTCRCRRHKPQGNTILNHLGAPLPPRKEDSNLGYTPSAGAMVSPASSH